MCISVNVLMCVPVRMCMDESMYECVHVCDCVIVYMLYSAEA